MTPEKAKAQNEAIEALIGASLRAPDKETEVTDEIISRYVDQRVPLNAEDKAALEKSKPGLLQAVKKLLQGNEQENHDCTARPEKAERVQPSDCIKQKRAPDEFVEAVVIAQLTRLIATEEHPLGRLRYNKMAYFSHRKAEEEVTLHFSKQPAGPYSRWAKYQGPEKIAVDKGYVKRTKAGNFEGLVPGDQIGMIDNYLERYPACRAIDWVVSKFRFRRNEELELLATVDFAALDLIQQRKAITAENIKHVIATSKKWTAKLTRDIFSDANIARALLELRGLFPSTYG